MAYLIHRNNEHSYLIHYNKNHSKANGQFISGDGDGDGITNDNAHRKYELKGGSKNAFGGKSKKEYKKELEEKYRQAGNNKLKSKRFASRAALMNTIQTNQYNKYREQNSEYAKKAKEAFDRKDYKKYNAYCKKMIDTYKKARINEETINRSYELGKILVEESDIYGALGVLGYTLYQNSPAMTSNTIYKNIANDVEKEVK